MTTEERDLSSYGTNGCQSPHCQKQKRRWEMRDAINEIAAEIAAKMGRSESARSAVDTTDGK